MTEVQDGDVVIVGSLVQTQVILQRVFQLTQKENENLQSKREAEVCVGIVIADKVE